MDSSAERMNLLGNFRADRSFGFFEIVFCLKTDPERRGGTEEFRESKRGFRRETPATFGDFSQP